MLGSFKIPERVVATWGLITGWKNYLEFLNYFSLVLFIEMLINFHGRVRRVKTFTVRKTRR